jgi:hypothetical protein
MPEFRGGFNVSGRTLFSLVRCPHKDESKFFRVVNEFAIAGIRGFSATLTFGINHKSFFD